MNLTRRNFLKLGIGAATVAAEEAYFGFFRRLLSPRLDVDSTISPYGEVIERVERVLPTGNIYLIGQAHQSPSTSKDGISYSHYEGLSAVQSNIYHTLLALKRTGLVLVIGEGLRIGEFTASKSAMPKEAINQYKGFVDDPNQTHRFFEDRTKEVPYTALEVFHPEMRVFGVDDSLEVEELNNLDRELFAQALKHIPRIEDQRDPIKIRKFEEVERKTFAEKRKLNDRRSRIYLSQGIQIADSQKQDDFAIVIGADHVRLMVDEYKDSRNLYVIRPKGFEDVNTLKEK